MNKKCWKLLLALTVFSFPVESTGASSGAGTSAATFLKLGAGPAEIAAAGAATADAAGAFASYWNPAGIARMAKDHEAAFSHAKWVGELSHFYTAFAKRFSQRGGVASFSITRLGTSQSGYDSSNNSTGKFSTSDIALGAAYGRGLEVFPHSNFNSERFLYWGGGVKLIRQSVPGANSYGVAVDGGLQTAGVETNNILVQVGMAARNWGPAMSLSGEKSPLPGQISAGGSAEIKSWGLRAALEVKWARDDGIGPSVGMGWSPAKPLELRMGYRGDAGGEGMGSLTFGGGLRWQGVSLDVAMLRQGKLGDTMNLGMTYAW